MPLRSVGGFQHHCDTTVWFSGLCPPSQRRLTPRPLATAWSVGSFGTAGGSSILVFLYRLVSFSDLVIVTRYFPSRVLMTLSLVIVTCFAVSFTLRSAAFARLVLDASLLHCTRAARPTFLYFAVQSFCWMRNSVFSFLFACCRARSFW